MKSFASDNNSGIHNSVIDFIIKANQGHSIGYGDDNWTKNAEELFKSAFGNESESFFVFNGTGSNIISLQLITRPYNSIICAETAHIYVDECGAPVKSTGCPIISIPVSDGKLTPELIIPYLHGFGVEHHSQPGAIYISQCTELGTVYTVEEIKAITKLAHEYGMYVHMDGARLANAAVYLNATFKEMTTDCDIDVLSFGGTKNGLMGAESVVILNPIFFNKAKFIRKQSAQLASKMRFISAQFVAYFTDDLWMKNAVHSNKMAQLLHDKLKNIPEITFTQDIQTNAIFLKLPKQISEKLMEKWFFYYWNEKDGEIRLVTSFDTYENDINEFICDLTNIINNRN
jgi:threonine aldolase